MPMAIGNRYYTKNTSCLSNDIKNTEYNESTILVGKQKYVLQWKKICSQRNTQKIYPVIKEQKAECDPKTTKRIKKFRFKDGRNNTLGPPWSVKRNAEN